MTDPVRASDTPIGVDVEEAGIISGVPAAEARASRFATAHTRTPALRQSSTRLKLPGRYSSVDARQRATSPYVTAVTTPRNI